MSFSRHGIDAMNAINKCYIPNYRMEGGLNMGNADGSHSTYTQNPVTGEVLRTTYIPNWQTEHFCQQAKMNFAPSIPVTEVIATNTDVSALLCLRCNKRGHIKDACTVLVATPKACCACKSTATLHDEKNCIIKNTCKHCGKVDDKHKADEDKCYSNPKNTCAFCGIIDYAHDQIKCGVAKQTNMIVPANRKLAKVADENPIVVKRTAESKAKNPNSVGDEYVVEGDKLNLYEKGKYVMSFSLEYLLQHLNVQPPTINVNPFANQPTLPMTNNIATETPNNNIAPPTHTGVASLTQVEIVDDVDDDETLAKKERIREQCRFKSILKKVDDASANSLVPPDIIDDEIEFNVVKTNTKRNAKIASPTTRVASPTTRVASPTTGVASLTDNSNEDFDF
jgi:hypothetical protein